MKNVRKKLIPFISILILILSSSFLVMANVNPVVDEAKLLSQDERNQLMESIEVFRKEYNMDLVIVTSNDLEGKKPRDYADDYYDYNGYGLGDNKSGLLLLIDMDDRNIWISTSGDAIEYFTDDRIESIIADTVKIVLIALVSAAIVAGVTCIFVVNSYKNSKSVSSTNYVDNNSIVFTKRRDVFVSTFTTKTKIEKNNNRGGGGSSTHTSSSGNTHGGGGGSF